MAERLVVSCEHAGKRVPHWLRPRFATPEARAALASHRGWDIGALPIARHLARALDAPLFMTGVSRLVVDTNRSLGHHQLFSPWTHDCTPDERERILAAYHHPHREAIREAGAEIVAEGDTAIHLGIHSFTPVLDGVVRTVDLALLYNPQREAERRLATTWLRHLATAAPDLRLRRNHPYRGNADGLTTTLRREFPPERYLGIEIEVNQALVQDAGARERIERLLADTARAFV